MDKHHIELKNTKQYYEVSYKFTKFFIVTVSYRALITIASGMENQNEN